MTSELQEQQQQLEQNAIEMEEKSNQIANANKKQHALLEKSSEVISIYNSEKEVIYKSPSVEKVLGYNAEELVGRKDFDLADESSENRLNNMFDKLIKHPNMTVSVEYSYRTQSGKYIWMEGQGRNMINDPAIKGIVLNARDITEKKKAEKEQIMRGKMQALSENSPDMILRFNLSGEFLYVNPSLTKVLGQTKEELEKTNFKSETLDIPNELIESWQGIIDEVKSSKAKCSSEVEFENHEKQMIVQINAIPEWNENGELDTILIVAHDITTNKQQERLIATANKKITDSINYAKRIQNSIIPDYSVIREDLPQSFIYYRPKDVVSGDFPWYFKKENTHT